MDTTIFLFAAIILALYLLTWHRRRLEIWQKIGLSIGLIMGCTSLASVVLGLSLGLPLLIRIIIGVASCVILTAVILSHYNLLCSPSQGEGRRKIEIEGLGKIRRNTITLTSFGRNPQLFVGDVWTISIHNELLESVSDCCVELQIFTDGRDRGYTLPLRWRGHEELPITSNVGGTIETRDDYRNSLPFSYIGRLYNSGADSVTIPADGRNEVLFSFTFSESDSMFIISLGSRYGLTEQDMGLITIPFGELDRNSFLIRFYNGQNTYEKMFSLNVRSWNEFNLVEV